MSFTIHEKIGFVFAFLFSVGCAWFLTFLWIDSGKRHEEAIAKEHAALKREEELRAKGCAPVAYTSQQYATYSVWGCPGTKEVEIGREVR